MDRTSRNKRDRGRVRAAVAAAGVGLLAGFGSLVPVSALAASTASASPTGSCPAGSQLQAGDGSSSAQCVITATGTPVGGIKHVWLIILENKSYDETFTGLNQNSYLWQTLPKQGALLTNYYGTGHFSMDNYISLVSGQAPSYDVQDDCSTTASMVNNDGGVIGTGVVGTQTDTDLTKDGSGTYTQGPTTSGATNGNLGQILAHGGVDAALGSNGCVFPDNVPTLFNQFNAAGVSWKGYAQDLGGAQPVGATSYVSDSVPGRDDGACGYPGTTSANPVTNPTNLTAPSGNVTSYTGAQPATATLPADQYVAKHFPFPWFTALTGQSAGTQSGVTYSASAPLNQPSTPEYDGPGAPMSGSADTNCDANHIANLDDPQYGLVHDLSLPSVQVPNFSWITPNNCSDAHDASCQGNNLSGAFNVDASGNLTTPDYSPASTGSANCAGGTGPSNCTGIPNNDPEATTPRNYTGGLYAADLFLRYYVPLIEQSAAFQDGGLIDVTFDEANPPFTTGNSFNNAATSTDTGTLTPADQPSFGSAGTTAPGATSIYGAYGLLADAAGENLYGKNVSAEPTGPNDPEVTTSSGVQLQPGPGASGFVDRPTKLTGESPYLSGSPGSATEQGQYSPSSSWVLDYAINAQDTGRLVSGPGIPNDTFVGTVSDTGPNYLGANASTTTFANQNAKPWTGTFQLVNDSGQPVYPSQTQVPTGTTKNITLGAEGATSTVGSQACPSGNEAATTSGCVTADPLYDATDFTPGGGDTGSVLISPYINPGTVSSEYFNHYSWLATMEDLFLTGATCTSNPTLYGTSGGQQTTIGSVCGGLDGLGHIGYAAQPGLAAFNGTVFTNPQGTTPSPALPEAAYAIIIPMSGLIIVGAYLGIRRRQRNALQAG